MNINDNPEQGHFSSGSVWRIKFESGQVLNGFLCIFILVYENCDFRWVGGLMMASQKAVYSPPCRLTSYLIKIN